MLKKDNNARFHSKYGNLNGSFYTMDYWNFKSGNLSLRNISVQEYESIMRTQKETPTVITKYISKVWWIFQDEIYWENDTLDAEAVKTLIVATRIRKKQKIERDIEKAKATIDQVARLKSDDRQPIPDDVKMFVWQRDKGRCVKCGSNQNLEYDHIIPVSMGGSNTARNLQILCEFCNRSKGGNII